MTAERTRAPLVDAEVVKHVQREGFDASLISVTHTPNALSTHLVASETGIPLAVRHEKGGVVTKLVSADYGTLLSVLGGPAIVEIALHDTYDQRAAYLEQVARVNAETADFAVVAIREAALALIAATGLADVHDGEPADDVASGGEGDR